jgi:hypothetical protein
VRGANAARFSYHARLERGPCRKTLGLNTPGYRSGSKNSFASSDSALRVAELSLRSLTAAEYTHKWFGLPSSSPDGVALFTVPVSSPASPRRSTADSSNASAPKQIPSAASIRREYIEMDFRVRNRNSRWGVIEVYNVVGINWLA